MSAVVVPYHRRRRNRDETAYGTSWYELVGTVYGQMRAAGPLIRAMIDVRDRYNAEWVLPGFEDFGDLTPLMVADAVDSIGMASAQVDPAVFVPPLDSLKTNGVRSQEYAAMRRKMITSTYHASAFDVGRGRAYRHLTGYATFTLLALPDFENEHMRLHVGDPLSTYCEPKDPEDLTPPGWIAQVYGKSSAWLRKHHPHCRRENGGPVRAKAEWRRGEEIWDCVRWIDGDSIVHGILGPRENAQSSKSIDVLVKGAYELYRVPNRIGFVPGVCPTQVTMDRILSAVHRITGRSDLMAKFTAMDIMGAEKALIPDTYIIGSSPGQQAKLVAGRWIDGREGEVNYVVDAREVNQLRSTPDPSGKIAHDRLEGEAKRSVGLVPQMQGETYGALRTGRGIDSLYGVSVDPRVAENHRIMGHALATVNRGILAGYRAYWGSKSFSMFSGRQGDSYARFKPQDHVEVVQPGLCTEHGTHCEMDTGACVEERREKLALDSAVVYPIPGADVLNTTMALGQLRAMKALPMSLLLRMHPWIPDPDEAERAIMIEDFEEGLKQALFARFQSGIPPEDAAKVIAKLRETGDIVAATALADDLAKQRMAEASAAPTGDPQREVGLGNAEEGAGAGGGLPPEVAEPRDAQSNLRELSMILKTRPGTRSTG